MRTYLGISSALFGVIALGHVLRLAFHWSAEIAGQSVPVWASLVALVAAASLSLWGLRLLRQFS
jgi:hypothetical protein